jgi:hypothetical protein
MKLSISRKRGRPPQPAARRTTHVQFTSEELVAISRFLAAGRVLLQEDYPPVVARLKAAMTRVGAEAPKGL